MNAPKLLIATISTALLAFFAAQLGCATTQMGGIPSVDEVNHSPAFDGADEVFVNAAPTDSELSFDKIREVMRRYRTNDQTPSGPIPLAENEKSTFSPPASGMQMTWVGHSTVLIQLDGFNVLTDPVWSERVSPVAWAGPRRFHAPAIELDDLPKIDAVIISHDHYDHLDHETVKQLAWRNTRFFVPLGVGAHLAKWGVRSYVELDWWDTATLEKDGRSLTLVATPARHFSGRGLLDRNKTLWASWAVLGEKHRVYFGGDTGYFDGFREIGRRYGPFDATLIPIGAYDPAWSDIHLNPEEAVRAHLDLGNHGTFVPIHYATFNLAAHAWDDPMERMRAAAQKAGVTQYAFPLPGEVIENGRVPPQTDWWRGAR